MRRVTYLIVLALLGCEKIEPPVLEALPPLVGNDDRAAPRVNGRVGAGDTLPAVQVTTGSGSSVALPQATAPGLGDISLNFVDADIREVVAQVLGTVLRVNYTIDPAVRGTATLRTTNPIARSQVLPALSAVLAAGGTATSRFSSVSPLERTPCSRHCGRNASRCSRGRGTRSGPWRPGHMLFCCDRRTSGE